MIPFHYRDPRHKRSVAPIRISARGANRLAKKSVSLWGRDVKGGFICHVLRHSFITDMRRARVDRTVRMAITGNANRDMNQLYDVVEGSDKLAAIGKLENYRNEAANVAKVRVLDF
jgi:integrase